MIGVLALQGDFALHMEKFEAIGHQVREVRLPRDLVGIDGLVIPGGESTTLGKLLVRQDLLEPMRKLVGERLPIFGTCAGLILLAQEIEAYDQLAIGGIPIRVRRNAYGRQIHSCFQDVHWNDGSPAPGFFIRAPKIIEIFDPKVEVLAHYGPDPVLIRHENILGATYHPELTSDTSVFQYFSTIVFNS